MIKFAQNKQKMPCFKNKYSANPQENTDNRIFYLSLVGFFGFICLLVFGHKRYDSSSSDDPEQLTENITNIINITNITNATRYLRAVKY